MVYNLKNFLSAFELSLGQMSFVYIIAIPILTMRIIAEEKRQKTDRLLYSLPMGMTRIVFGKYFLLWLYSPTRCNNRLISFDPLTLR